MPGWFPTVLMAAALCAVFPVSAAAQDDPDRDPNAAQPDFTVGTLSTTLRLPQHKYAFRLTHRFLRPLGDGDAGDLLSRFFGFDSGAQVGLEVRYGLFKGGQVGLYRTSDRTIQLFGQYDIRSQTSSPVGLDVVVNVDGLDNFSKDFSPGIALIVSREVNDRAALYVEPSFIANTNLTAMAGGDRTILIGLGARVRASKNVYVFVEGSPRVAGYRPGAHAVSFGIERRAGGHLFQLNFSDGFGTTLAQVARGGTASEDWYIGFNLTRRFF